MSGQYLEAHAFLKTLRDKGVPYTETLVNLMQYAVIEGVAPVVHAQWLHVMANLYDCSNCFGGLEIPWEGEITDYIYCPYCGAKMDGGHNDG